MRAPSCGFCLRAPSGLPAAFLASLLSGCTPGDVELYEPGADGGKLTSSEGKAKRVLDQRGR